MFKTQFHKQIEYENSKLMLMILKENMIFAVFENNGYAVP